MNDQDKTYSEAEGRVSARMALVKDAAIAGLPPNNEASTAKYMTLMLKTL
jgi:hypothetical protein